MKPLRLVHNGVGIPEVFTFTSLAAPGKTLYVTDGVDFNTVYNGWTDALFNDSAWPAPTAVLLPAPDGHSFVAPIPGTSWITSLDAEHHEFGGGRDWLYRRVFSLPPGQILSGSFAAQLPSGGAMLDVLKINGANIVSSDITSRLVAGNLNTLAFHLDQIFFLGFTVMCYKITVSFATLPPPLRLSTGEGTRTRLVHHSH